jgi:PilZ domain-containing protein
MKNYDSREVPRYELPSELSVVYEGAAEKVPLHPADLSTRGMFVHSPKPLPEGSVVKVHFRLRRMNFVVDVRAEVRHCIPGAGFGVEFLDLDSAARHAIEQELGFLDSSVSGPK